MNNDIVHLKADTLFIITSVLQSNLKNVAKMRFAIVSSKANFMIIFESGMKRIPKVSGMQPSIITQMDNHMSGCTF